MNNKKNNNHGRSMIEMLGVLAIIGILSVGGIAGFSKAIERHRINETINQITLIAQNTRDLFKSQNNYSGLHSSLISMSDTTYANRILADKALLFPESLRGSNYENLFGGDIYLYRHNRFSADDGKAFALAFHGIPKSACLELATREWQGSLGLVALRVQGSSNSTTLGTAFEGNCTTSHAQGNAVVCAADLPMPLSYAVEACDTKNANILRFKFY